MFEFPLQSTQQSTAPSIDTTSSDAGDVASQSSLPEGRTRIACKGCALAKVKCDRKVPCNRCTEKKLNCSPRIARRVSVPQKGNHRTAATPSDPNAGQPSCFDARPWVDHTDYGSSSLQPNPDFLDMFGVTYQENFRAPSALAPTAGTMPLALRTSPESPADFSGASLSSFEDFFSLNKRDDVFDEHGLRHQQLPFDNIPSFDVTPLSETPISSRHPSFADLPFQSLMASPLVPGSRAPEVAIAYGAQGTADHEAIVAAQDAWSCFRCNPPTSLVACPQTTKVHLDCLVESLRDQDFWASMSVESVGADQDLRTDPLVGATRDKLLVMMQSYYRNAADSTAGRSRRTDHDRRSFIILPPSDVLQHFLNQYACRFEPYYPFIPGGILDPNKILQSDDPRASALLLLLMVAQGASATPLMQAQFLSGGLIETCRISLIDMLEKDTLLSTQPSLLRAALIFIASAAWGGDKWHMDIALGQRRYLSMLHHADVLSQSDWTVPLSSIQEDVDSAWESWKDHEGKNRLVYSWVAIDQEISLFHDEAPALPVGELSVPMPGPDRLWKAPTAAEWLGAWRELHGDNPGRKQMPLNDMFRNFLNGAYANDSGSLSATQVRLLLYPMQILSCHLSQFQGFFPSTNRSSSAANRLVSVSSTRTRLDELSTLLQQWYRLSRRCFGTEFSAVACTSLILYHLICLNNIVDFPEMERIARESDTTQPFQQSFALQIRCIEEAEEVTFHCGQVFRLIYRLPRSVKPSWWAAAVYRATIITWITSTARATTDVSVVSGQTDSAFAIDALPPEHPMVQNYLSSRAGEPMLSRKDGTMAPLKKPGNVLAHALDVLDADMSMRFTHGIRNKLARLAQRWNLDLRGGSHAA